MYAKNVRVFIDCHPHHVKSVSTFKIGLLFIHFFSFRFVLFCFCFALVGAVGLFVVV